MALGCHQIRQLSLQYSLEAAQDLLFPAMLVVNCFLVTLVRLQLSAHNFCRLNID